MVSRRDYSDEIVEAARSVQLEVMRILGEYQDDIVIVGGWVPELLILDAEEKHSGTISFDLGPFIAPPGGPIPRPIDLDFAVDLSQEEDFNWSVGTHMMLSDAWEATVEVGAGDRRTVLANLTYRFE